MDDLNDPRISAYKPQRRILLPAPPGPHRKKRLSKAQRKQQARAEARAARMHLVGLTDAAAIIMGVVVAAVVVVLIVVMISHH
jgi:hypothetical protein